MTAGNVTKAELLQVFVPIGFDDFEYCGVGCYIGIALLGPFTALAYGYLEDDIRFILLEFLKGFFLLPFKLLRNLVRYPGACFSIAAATLAAYIEVVYAFLSFAKLISLWKILTAANKGWLLLSGLGFAIDGGLEVFGFTYDFGGDKHDGNFQKWGQQQEASDDAHFSILLGSLLELVLMMAAFSLVTTILLPMGWLAWISVLLVPLVAYSVHDHIETRIHTRQDSSRGELKLVLCIRVVEAIFIAIPLMILGLASKSGVGTITVALLIRDVWEIMLNPIREFVSS